MWQSEVEEINEEYKKQRAALEKQYELLRAPILEKRRDIVSGEIEVALEDTESGEWVSEWVSEWVICGSVVVTTCV